MKKKRILSLLVSAVLAFSLTPAAAFADEPAQGGGAYAISIEKAVGGTVTASKTSAAEGDVITLTAKANDGYAVESVSAGTVTVTKGSNGTYTFKMPAANVKVTAKFKQQGAAAAQPEPAAEAPAEAQPAPEAAQPAASASEAAPAEEAEAAATLVAAADPEAEAASEGEDAAEPEKAQAAEPKEDTTLKAAADGDEDPASEGTDGEGDGDGKDGKDAEATTYTVTIESASNGSVEADKTKDLAGGETVTITSKPASGYHLKSLSYTAEGSSATTIKPDSNGKLAFEMPKANVKVTATFEAHTWDVTTTTTEPTCTKSGTKTITCSSEYCNESKTETIPALGHSWGAWKVTKKATLSAKGTETRTCSNCGDTQNRSFTYNVAQGANSTWTKGTKTTVAITVKRTTDDSTCFSHFTNVQIDGTTLAAADYDAKSGSTVITLKAATLERYSAGSHTVTVNFDDGVAQAKVTVKAASGSSGKSSTAKTGDTLPAGIVAGLAVVCIAAAGTTVLARKKMSGK